ncbi:hypothetical protein HDU85_007730 [Gaertneriomyces sp. JEL0708]|nr:hypothetical protein HDU85_007730 [Gaertneriomyces sp. JEL0708]
MDNHPSSSSLGFSVGPARGNDEATGGHDDLGSNEKVTIDTTAVPIVRAENDAELENLSTELGADFVLGVSDQAELEKNVMAQVDDAMRERDNEADEKRLEKTQKKISGLREKVEGWETKAIDTSTGASVKRGLYEKIAKAEDQLDELRDEERDIRARIRDRKQQGAPHGRNVPMESERERLIRTGKITPFSNITAIERHEHGHEESVGASTLESEASPQANHPAPPEPSTQMSQKNKRRRDDEQDGDYLEDNDEESSQESKAEEDGILDAEDLVVDEDGATVRYKDRHMDDGDEVVYQKRIREWARKRRLLRLQRSGGASDISEDDPSLREDPTKEMFQPSPAGDDAEYEGGYRMPGDIYSILFEYQRTCTRWLWELHSQDTGGIIGDEMGLGKTIQMISFLAGLSFSGLLNGPVLIVCPATVLRQWVQEFHRWWPPFRVVILHSTGTGLGQDGAIDSDDPDVEDDVFIPSDDDASEAEDRRGGIRTRRATRRKPKKPKKISAKQSKMLQKAGKLIERVVQRGHIVLTTFAGVRVYSSKLLPVTWSYCILDEGHKIRNPDAEITLACKQLRTPHRIILTGTPIQNNLTELWSLFDFVFPGRLGTLPVFQSQFAVPISIGGYANASNVQVQTAYKCACVLRDLISPYLLRRMKSDVATDLPKKSEQVLFCRLTDLQRKEYVNFLNSGEVTSILDGRRHALYGIDLLRKICNHPDLLDRKEMEHTRNYGMLERSGKMKVVQALLRMWRSQGHKALLFCQTRQMQDILEKFLAKEGYNFRRMDGSTPIRNRIAMVDEFNESPAIFVFLLTTKVGGLGINLTGANRIIIYDPDWNPSTDVQARERAWRVGQQKEVVVYRLMTAGTIEEKIYHRQIFKQFLTNKILKDPRQRRFFKSNDMRDLFTLSLPDSNGTETGDLFHGSNAEITFNSEEERTRRRKRKAPVQPDEEVSNIDDVAKVDDYQPPANTDDTSNVETVEAVSGSGENEEDRMLKSIFSKSGVHSALKHDIIVDAANPEMLIIEKEASRVANEAISVLRQSRRSIRQREGVHVPTFTGRSGAAGAPVQRPRFGPASGRGISRTESSSPGPFGSGNASGFRNGGESASGPVSSTSILATLRERSAIERNSDGLTGVPVTHDDLDPNSQEGLIVRIRDYVASRGGQASTPDILGAFQRQVKKDDVMLFRKMLKGICDFRKQANEERGVWVLKEEFR